MKKYLITIFLSLICAVYITAQELTVTGRVTDAETGESLPGVNILIVGTNQGTTTDANGNYEIKVPSANSVLEFSFLGYNVERINVEGKKSINVVLIPELKKLDEIVVVGYGTMRRRDLTGAVTSIKSEDIEKSRGANVLQALQGKVSGLDIQQSSGQAGSGFSLKLRGDRSITASNSPLILVDGVEYGSTIDINPSDIESIEILKDASSTAIYGTRGANGVIIITTKKGKAGRSTVTFNSYVSYNQPTYVPQVMNSWQFVQKRIENLIADKEQSAYSAMNITYNNNTKTVSWNSQTYPEPWNVFGSVSIQQIRQEYSLPENEPDYYLISTDPTVRELLDNGVSLNYLDMILNNSVTDNYELGFYGGSENTSIGLSLGLMNDRGLLKNDLMNRTNFKITIDHKVNNIIKVGGNILFTHKKYNRRDGGVFNQALKTGPIGKLYNDDGTLNEYPDRIFTFAQPNPLLDEVEGAYKNEILSNRIFGNAYISLEIIKGLTFKSNLNLDLNTQREGMYQGPKCLARISLKKAYTYVVNDVNTSYTIDNTLNYQKDFNQHTLSILLGNSIWAVERENYRLEAPDQKTSITEFYDFNKFDQTTTITKSSYSAQQMLSFFGRLNYSFIGKYLFQATLRTDGSSVLTEGNKWDMFPSVSAGWRISEESFLQDFNWLNNLKLRISYGITGNAAVKPYQTLALMSDVPIYYTFEDEIYSSLFPYQMGVRNLRWEKTSTIDLGIDFSLFKDRIYGSIDVYDANTKDLLFYQNLPLTSVYPQVIANIGSTNNKGIEIELTTVNLKNKDIDWRTTFNFSTNKNKITKLATGMDEYVYGNGIYKVGEPVLSFYDYKKEGIYQISDLQKEFEYVRQQIENGQPIERNQIPMIANKFYPGDIKLYDANNDGYFDDNDKVLYTRTPKFIFGLNNSLTYKYFGLSFDLIGRIGQYIRYDFYASYKPAGQTAENGPYVDAWTPENTDAEFPRYYKYGNGATNYNASLFYIEGSYLKIRDLTLSFSMPKEIANRVYISKMKFYLTLKNYFTFSKIDNYDPERGGAMTFPLPKQIIGGLSLEF